MNLNNTSSGSQYNNVGSGSQYNANIMTIHQAANDSGDRDKQFLIDLRLSDPRLHKQDIEYTKGGLLKDSYLWILNNEDFQSWRADFRNRLLWIRGDPGKGKTMLLCGIVDEFQKETSAHQPIYFFCQATDSNLTTASAVLRGILYLMLKKKPQLIKDLRETHDHSDRRLFEGSNGWNVLCDMLIRVLAHESFQNAVIVIDALDECTAGVDKLLDFIHVLSSKAVRIIISSRNWPSIERGIASAAQQAAHVSLELNEHSISTAVVAFIDHKVNELARKHEYSAMTRDLVYNTLVQNSDSTFLWAALVCQQLADNNTNNWEVGSKLAEFPPGLDVLYARMLHHALSSSNVNLLRRILAVALVVFRPITIAELRSLLGPLGDMFNEPRFLEKAVRQCGSFLTVRNNTVYFVHQSAKDFLLGTTTVQKIMVEGIRYEHALIWTNSLQAMSTTLRHNIHDLKTPGTSVDDAQPQAPDPLEPIRYSCVHWIHHFCMTKWIDRYQADQMEDFFKHSFLHWAEAICLLRSVYEGAESMGKLSSALEDLTGVSKLAALVKDASRFLQQHRQVVESTPLQIYCSVLLFSPKKSIVRELYQHEVPDWILNKPVVKEDEWETSLRVLGNHDHCQTVTFSLDGRFLASTSLEEVKIWNVNRGQCLRAITPPDGRVVQVTFSHDGTIVAAIVGNFLCKLWNVETGICSQTLPCCSGKINSIAFSQNGRNLAMGSDDTTVMLWDIETGICLRRFHGHNSPIVAIAFSPDGYTLASAATSIKVWNAETGDCVQNMQPNFNFELCSMIYTDEGRQIVSISWNPKSSRTRKEMYRIESWELSTGKCHQVKDLFLPDYFETGAARSPLSLSPHNGGMVASRVSSKTISMGKLQRGAELYSKVYPYRIAGISISSDGRSLAIVSSEGTVGVQDLTTHHHKQHNARGLLNSHYQYGTQDAETFPGHHNYDCANYSSVFNQIDSRIQSINFSASGQQIISLCRMPPVISVWDAKSGDWLRSLDIYDARPASSHVESAAALTRDHQILLATLERSGVVIRDASDGRSIQEIHIFCGPTHGMVFSADATRLAISSFHKRSSSVQVYDVKTGRCMWDIGLSEVERPSRIFSPPISSVPSQSSFAQWFSQSGLELHTKYGTIDLVEREKSRKTALVLAHSSYAQLSKSTLRGYYIEGQWIMKDMTKMVWLPEEYRPWNGSYVVRGSTLALGCESGHVIIIQFS